MRAGREFGVGAWSKRHGFARTCGRGGTAWLLAALWLACASAHAQQAGAEPSSAAVDAPVQQAQAAQAPAASTGANSERQPRLDPVLAPARSVPYRVGLGIVYALGPSLFLPAFLLDDALAFAWAAIPLTLLAPPIYHAALRQPALAVRTAWAYPLTMVIGGTVGTLLGVAIGAAKDADPGDDDGYEIGAILGAVFGSAAGAGLGWLVWATFDVATAKLEPHERKPSSARAGLSLEPIVTPLVSRGTSGARLAGVLLGVEGRM